MDSRYLVEREYVHVEDGQDGPAFLVCENGDCGAEWLEDYRRYIQPCTSIGDPCSAVKTAPACVAVDGLEWSHGMGAAQQRSAVPPLPKTEGRVRSAASAAARKGEA